MRQLFDHHLSAFVRNLSLAWSEWLPVKDVIRALTRLMKLKPFGLSAPGGLNGQIGGHDQTADGTS